MRLMPTGEKTTGRLSAAGDLAAVLKSARATMRKDKGLSGDLDRLPVLTWLMFLKFVDDLDQQGELEAELGNKEYRPIIEAPYRWRDWATKPSPTGDELLAFISAQETPDPFGVGEVEEIPGLFEYLRTLSSARGVSDGRSEALSNVFSDIENRMKSGYLLREVVEQVDKLKFKSIDDRQTLGMLYEEMLREMRDAAGDSGEFYTPRPLVRLMVELMDPRLGEVTMDPASGTGGFLVEAFSHLQSQVDTVEQRTQLQTGAIVGAEPKPLPYLLCQMNLILHGVDSPVLDHDNSLRFKLNEIGDKDRVDVILTNPPFGGEEEKGVQGNFPAGLQTAETALLFLQLIMRRLKRTKTPVGNNARAAVVVPNGTLYATGVAMRIRQKLIDEFRLRAVLRFPKGVFEPYTDIASNVLFFDRSDPGDGVWIYDHPLPAHRAHLKGRAYSASDGLKFEEFEPFVEWWKAPAESDHAFWLSKDDLIKSEYDLAVANPLQIEEDHGNLDDHVRHLSISLTKSQETLQDLASSVASITVTEAKAVSLGDLLTQRSERVAIEADKNYRRLRVQLHFRGILLRDEKEGSAIGTKNQTVVRDGDFVFSRIDARNGAMGLVPAELDGAIVTNDFPSFEVNSELIDSAYLRFCLFNPEMLMLYGRLSRGSTNRRRLAVEPFLNLEVVLPGTLEEQRNVAASLTILENSVTGLTSDFEAMGGLAGQFVPAALRSLFRCEG